MPYATDRDRDPQLLELESTPWPAPPLNLFITSGYTPGTFDLTWDDPSQLALNSRFYICGVNIYRSFDSEYGPFTRVTDLPVGAIFWRDQNENVLVVEEEVEDEDWIMRGVNSASELDAPRYVFRVKHWPIVKPESQIVIYATDAVDVEVKVDGVVVPVLRIFGFAGEVELDTVNWPEVGTQSKTAATLPGPNSKVTVTYRYNRDWSRSDLVQRVFYRVTTVGIPVSKPLDQVQPQDLVETPLERATATSNYEIEKIDYIWREAVRRNRWILQEGGERVKLFIRKHVGQTCQCWDYVRKQPLYDCDLCFGTGILGGYEGPYDILVAPDDSDKKIAFKDIGLTVEHIYEVWTGPRPLVSQRDFLVKLNGDRYSIGPVRMPTNRGMVLQQHFSINHLDEKDITYKVPLDNPMRYVSNQVASLTPPDTAGSATTDKQNIPDEREIRGRTGTWENITY